MNHFKLEIIINDYIKHFRKEYLIINLIEIKLYNESNDKCILIKDRRYNILYTSLESPISFNLFILNKKTNDLNDIEFLIKNGFKIQSVKMDLYYNDVYIEDYYLNREIGEQVDLITVINERTNFNITTCPSIDINNINDDLNLIFLPINDDNIPVKRKLIEKNSEIKNGIDFNGSSTIINNNGILDTFNKVQVLISSNGTIIAPKDLDYLSIDVGKQLIIKFINNNESILKKQIRINNVGTLDLIYLTPFFKLNEIRTISLGYLSKINNQIYFDFNISYHDESKSVILLNLENF